MTISYRTYSDDELRRALDVIAPPVEATNEAIARFLAGASNEELELAREEGYNDGYNAAEGYCVECGDGF